MIEFITHSLGICGDGHPNIFIFLLNEVGIFEYFNYIYDKVKKL
jgi:hypothetical protein